MIRKLGQFMKRLIWVVVVGTMIAFHNFYTQEFKSIDKVEVEIMEDEEE